MTTRTADTRLRELGAYVVQLTQPIHIAIRGKVITHPSLLDQVREAATPGRAGQQVRSTNPPDSRPPVRLDPLDVLAEIEVDVAGWKQRLRLPSPDREVDWFAAVLRALVGVWPNLPPDRQEWLYLDVESWWSMAARAAGWRQDDLRRIQ